MSIITYKIPHENNYSKELSKAKQIANFAVENPTCKSTKYVNHIKLTSSIANQILKKYGNKTIKKVSRVKLIVPNQSIKLDKDNKQISIPCLKTKFNYEFHNNFEKINQIEIDNKYYYVSIQLSDEKEIEVKHYLGIDRNTTGYCIVGVNNKNNQILKLGKKAHHIHLKYLNIRKKLQKNNKKKQLVAIRKRERNIEKDLNHQISRKVVNYAKKHGIGIKLEKLTGIRNTSKTSKSFSYSLNSWSYYQLELFILYKAKLLGIPVLYIDPRYTSQTCSKCGLLGNRKSKTFKCPHCGHTSHADVNAAFNISNSEKLIEKSIVDRRKLSTKGTLISRCQATCA